MVLSATSLICVSFWSCGWELRSPLMNKDTRISGTKGHKSDFSAWNAQCFQVLGAAPFTHAFLSFVPSTFAMLSLTYINVLLKSTLCSCVAKKKMFLLHRFSPWSSTMHLYFFRPEFRPLFWRSSLCPPPSVTASCDAPGTPGSEEGNHFLSHGLHYSSLGFIEQDWGDSDNPIK